MEETGKPNANKKFITKRRSFRGGANPHEHHHHYHHHQHQLLLQQYSTQFGFCYQNEYQRYYPPALLPLPSLLPLQLALTPSFTQNQTVKSKTHSHKSPCKLNNSPFAASSYNKVSVDTVVHGNTNY